MGFAVAIVLNPSQYINNDRLRCPFQISRLSWFNSQLRLSGSNLIPGFASCCLLKSRALTDWCKKRSASGSGCCFFNQTALLLSNRAHGFWSLRIALSVAHAKWRLLILMRWCCYWCPMSEIAVISAVAFLLLAVRGVLLNDIIMQL